MRWLVWLSVLSLVLGGAAHAAGPFELFGFNPRGKAMAGAQTASVDDYTACFYNPARLTERHELNFGSSLHLAYPNTRITLDNTLPQDSPYQPNNAQTEGGLAMGFDFPVGGKLKDHLAVGLAVYLPAFEIARVRVPDPAQPHFYLYENSPARMEVMPAIAVRWVDGVSTGVGLRATGALVGPTSYRVDPVAGTVDQREFDTGLKYVVAPTLGLSLGPFWGVRLGAVYRGALAMPIDFPTHIEIDGMKMSTDIRFAAITSYSPHTASVGLAYQALEGTLRLDIDLQYTRWSDAPDPSVQFAIDAEGQDLDRLGFGDSLDIPAPGLERSVDLGLVDTFTPRVGVEYWPLDMLRVRLGYAYQPTPVPDQTSGSNYIGNNTHVVATGLGIELTDPLDFFSKPIHVDASAAVFVLAQRQAIKDDGNDPVGNWTAGGQIYDFSVSIGYDY